MKVTVTTLSDEIFVLDVSEDLELENFKAFCEIESGHSARDILIVHEGKPLLDGGLSMKSHGVKDGDVVILQHIQSQQAEATSHPGIPNLDFSSIQVPSAGATSDLMSGPNPSVSRSDDPARLRDLFLQNPDQLALLKQNNPRLADAFATGSLEEFSKVLREQIEEREQRELQKMRMMSAHPFDVEAQRLIAEEIKKKNIEANMEAAMEYNPETFGTVVMLYINCTVNGYPVKAFIDSGAQTTIMSARCAERVNIMRLVDTRWAGIAKGVGVQRIIGRIHMVQIAIENDHLTTSFSVLEDQSMDMLLGLDMLMRHQCCIDLKKNVLRIGTTGTETMFLGEAEIPDCARLTQPSASSSNEPPSKKKPSRGYEDQRKRWYFNISGWGVIAYPGPRKGTTLIHIPSKVGPSSSLEMDHALTILPGDKFTETEVKELVSFGFSREQAINELRRFNGDKKSATAALFAKSLKF